MRVVGRFEIVERIVSGACETYSARDPHSGQTVLLHLLEANGSGSPEDRFRAYAPDCPGAVLESGADPETRRAFVVTEYPKDRKALMLWIRQLGAAKPKPAESPAPPLPPAASDGATRMLDPSAIFGSAPRPPLPAVPPSPTAAPPSAPAPEGSTRMLDASALASHLPPALGTPHPPAKPAAAAPPAEDSKKPGAFTQAFAFPQRKTGERPRIELPKAAPAPPSPAPPDTGETKAFSSAALAGMLPKTAPPVKAGPEPKSVRLASEPTPPAPPPDTGETKAFSSAALAGMVPTMPSPRPATPPPTTPKATPAPHQTHEMPAPLRPAAPTLGSPAPPRTTPVRPSPTPAVLTPAPLKRAPAPPAPAEEPKWSPATIIAIAAVALLIIALIVYVVMK